MKKTVLAKALLVVLSSSVVASEAPKSWVELKLMQGAPLPPDRLVTKENAWNAPFNRWTFQNMRAIYTSVAIGSGLGPLQPFEHDPVDLDELAVKGIEGEASTLTGCCGTISTPTASWFCGIGASCMSVIGTA